MAQWACVPLQALILGRHLLRHLCEMTSLQTPLSLTQLLIVALGQSKLLYGEGTGLRCSIYNQNTIKPYSKIQQNLLGIDWAGPCAEAHVAQ